MQGLLMSASLVVVLVVAGCSRASEEVPPPAGDPGVDLSGFREGAFMPETDLDLTLALQFVVAADSVVEGRVLLWQGRDHIQDDRLSGIRLDGRRLRFSIPAKRTTFGGELLEDGRIVGRFGFPDGSVQAVDLSRVDGPTLPMTMPPSIELAPVLKITREEAARDLDSLMSVIARTHPRPFRFVDRSDFEASGRNLAGGLPDTVDVEAFLRYLRPLVSSLRCVHTAIRAPAALEHSLLERAGFLPVQIRIVDRTLYVTDGRSRADIQAGTIIESINGISSEELIQRIGASIAVDGLGEAHRLFRINQDFAVAYADALGIAEAFELRVRLPDGSQRSLALPGEPHEAVRHAVRPITVAYLEDGRLAHLAVPTFGPPDLEVAEAQLDSVFAELKRRDIRSLILDVRGNTGGHPRLAARLIAHLTDQPFRYFTGERRGSGDLDPMYDMQQPVAPAFDGEVVILTDGAAVSTTGHFLAIAKSRQLGLLVGSASGGTYWSNDMSRTVSLPASRIEVNVPTRTYEVYAPGLSPERGVRPDVEVKAAIDDILAGRDPVLDAALAELRFR